MLAAVPAFVSQPVARKCLSDDGDSIGTVETTGSGRRLRFRTDCDSTSLWVCYQSETIDRIVLVRRR